MSTAAAETDTAPDAIITTREAAVILGVTRNRVQQYARLWIDEPEKGLRHERAYKTYFFRVRDVEDFRDFRLWHNDTTKRRCSPGRRYKTAEAGAAG